MEAIAQPNVVDQLNDESDIPNCETSNPLWKSDNQQGDMTATGIISPIPTSTTSGRTILGEIDRSAFWRMIYSFYGDTFKSLGFSETGVVFSGSIKQSVSFLEIIKPPAMNRGMFLTVIELPMWGRSSMSFAGVRPADARNFVAEIGNAWTTTWRNHIRKQTETIRSISSDIDEIEDSHSYPAACRLDPLWQKAKDLLQELPNSLPEYMIPIQTRQLIGKISIFVDSPRQYRNTAIDSYFTNELQVSDKFFNDIGENSLSQEQRRAVVCEEEATLVLAGAGSGKTSVITTKASWLVERKIREPGQILLLAYANDASEEMAGRIQNRSGALITVMTFHKLANEIIASVEGEKPPVASHAKDDKGFQNLLQEILRDLISSDETIACLVSNWFTKYFTQSITLWDVESEQEYQDYIKTQELRTLRGELVNSFEELEIANWLAINGICYEYEPIYEHTLPFRNRKAYTPDFRLTDSGIYIEHFGVRREIDNEGNVLLTTAPFIPREKYLEEMEWKRQVHAEKGTILIETFSQDSVDNRLTVVLEQKLSSYRVQFNPIPLPSLIEDLSKSGKIDKLTKMLASFLRHFKGACLTLKSCREKALGNQGESRSLAFLKIFEAVHAEYQQRLESYIDFEDMIARAIEYVESGRYESPFRHFLVDEFQDISRDRAQLLLALKKQHSDVRIFAVGDDWQSIYRFSGSDISLMRRFGEIFGGVFANETGIHQTIDLGRTFRCVDQISEPARKFVLRNPSQIPKMVIPATTSRSPTISILENLSRRNSGNAVEYILSHIIDVAEGKTTSVLILGRYSFNLPEDQEHFISIHPMLELNFKTIHSSKGLEADHVVILGAKSGRYGFPSEISDDPLLNLVLPASEHFPHAEERRLFYVALTRARRTVTIVNDPDKPSCFVTELQRDHFNHVKMI